MIYLKSQVQSKPLLSLEHENMAVLTGSSIVKSFSHLCQVKAGKQLVEKKLERENAWGQTAGVVCTEHLPPPHSEGSILSHPCQYFTRLCTKDSVVPGQ